MSTPPMSKIAMVPGLSSRPSTSCFLGCAISSPTVSITAPICVMLSPNSASGPSRLSNAPLTRPDFNCCHGDGSSNEPSLGSTETAGWPKISRLRLPAPKPGFTSPPCSCSSGDWPARSTAYAIKIRTLRALQSVLKQIAIPNRRDWARRLSCLGSLAEAKQNFIQDHIFVGFAYFIFICTVLLAIGNLLSLGFMFEINYNEGWNVYNADRLIHGELVYDDNYWRINNYPVGSFLIISGANVLIHNLLQSGRLVALVSFVAIGVFAAIAVRRFGGGRTDAVFGASCAMGFCYLMAPAWIMADDPQTLGEAVMLGALVSYVARRPGRLSLLRTAFLVVLGGFIKHNLVAIPIAITFDLAFRVPRRLPFWLVSCAGFVAGFLGLTQIVAGGDFIDHLMSPRLFGWYGARYHLMKYLRLFKFPLT